MKLLYLVLGVLSLSCCKKTTSPTSVPGRSATGVLAEGVITEKILDQDFVTGMTQDQVESRIGKAYQYKGSNTRFSATYYIDRELTNTSELIRFTVVYEDGKIHHIDKSWLSKRGL